MGMDVVLNERLSMVEPSKSVAVFSKIKELQAVNPDILNLTAGEPDFDTPKAISEEAIHQILAGYTHYVDARGLRELRELVAEKLKVENNAPRTADEILITPGGKYGIYLAIQALINPGEEAIWLTPGWVSYPAIITLCGGTPVAVNLGYNQDYAIKREDLEAKTTDKTRLLILNYPNNPTGKILSDNDIEELSAYLRAHPDILVLSDEVYEKIVYDGRVSRSLASIPEFFDRVMIANGFSKCSAMTGWRLGYLAAAPKILNAAYKIFMHSMSCTNAFVQKAAIEAFKVPEETEMMRQSYEKRGRYLYEEMLTIPHVEFKMPEGAFYAWIKFDTKLNAQEMCNKLLDDAAIASLPGDAYGEENGCLIRMCFAVSEEVLKEMLVRLRKMCEDPAWV